MLQARLDSADGDRRRRLPEAPLRRRTHPYGRPDLGTPKTVKALTRDDVVAFHKRLFVPNNASLIVVGDTTPDAITARSRRRSKDWKPGEAPERDLPEPPSSPKPVTVYLVDKPGAAQSVLAVGQVGRRRGARPTTSR